LILVIASARTSEFDKVISQQFNYALSFASICVVKFAFKHFKLRCE